MLSEHRSCSVGSWQLGRVLGPQQYRLAFCLPPLQVVSRAASEAAAARRLPLRLGLGARHRGPCRSPSGGQRGGLGRLRTRPTVATGYADTVALTLGFQVEQPQGHGGPISIKGGRFTMVARCHWRPMLRTLQAHKTALALSLRFSAAWAGRGAHWLQAPYAAYK
jgi:hypothetical protein